MDRPLPEDTLAPRDPGGFTVQGSFRWADVPALPVGLETSAMAAREASSKLELAITVDLFAAGRMRLTLQSRAFPLPAGTELRARTSYFGHVMVWPDQKSYRVLQIGRAHV